MTESGPELSVVVPTLNEASTLPHLLADLASLDVETDVVVSDGGSLDATREIAREHGATVVSGAAGRGAQLRRGAGIARGRWLAFLHADSRLDPRARGALARFLDGAATTDFAHFRLSFEDDDPVFRAIELGQRLRERAFGMPYGDQGLIVSRASYDRVGGFPNWPIMEDVGIVDRLSKRGRRVVLDAPIRTSGRRYRREGPLRAWLRNVTLIVAFRLGADPDALARRYRPERPDRPVPPRREVLVFARAPVPGRVKTRLAADVGDDEAARIYRRLGRDTVDAVRDGPWSVTVHVEPPDAEAIDSVRAWLGPRVRYRGQVAGDLGDRMASAIEDALARVEAVCVVGTDLPHLDASMVRGAFEALENHDVVLGPATDGGYYLIGMTDPHPELFREIPWSTEDVLAHTVQRAADRELRVAKLEPRTDVDTVADVPAEMLPRRSAGHWR